MLWELLFMLVILKIPVFYLCAIVWWAIRAEPRPLEGAIAVAAPEPVSPCDWRDRSRRRGTRPRAGRGGGGGRRTRSRRAASASARRGQVAS
ncbi:MAG TPA: hypothetical protein VNT58_10695 [Gaiellaceae bacterium]|nr:hypothetical protein [Gaiellaceae bacterium]